MRDHTLVHEVDLKFIEQAKAKRESKRVPDVERDPAQSPWKVNVLRKILISLRIII